MPELFIDTVAEHITGAMQQEIAEQLFEDWSNKNLDEGAEYAEYEFMQYASPEFWILAASSRNMSIS